MRFPVYSVKYAASDYFIGSNSRPEGHYLLIGSYMENEYLYI